MKLQTTYASLLGATIALGALLLGGACGKSSSGGGQLISIPDNVSDPSLATSSGLALTGSTAAIDATALQMNIVGCASGWRTKCNSGSFEVYLGDQACIAQLQSFNFGSKTYNASSSCSSITWQAGSQCSFVNSKDSTDTVSIQVVEQLSTPTVSTDKVIFEWGEVGTGTAQLYSASTLGFAVNDSLIDQQDPPFQISNLLYYGVNSNGTGKFAMDLLCQDLMTVDPANPTQGQTLCDQVKLSQLDYALVAYPTTGVLSPSVLDALIAGSVDYTIAWQGTTNSSSSDKISTGNGGWVTKIMNGPGLISTANNMLLILRWTTGSGTSILKSYRTYQVQLAALPDCGCN